MAVESTSLLTKLSQIPVLGRVSLLGSTLVAGKVLSEATSGFQEGKVICVFRNVTGLPCPFCGGTRSVGSVLSGDLAEAWSFNPLGLVAVAFFSLALLNPNIYDNRGERGSLDPQSSSHAMRIMTVKSKKLKHS